jgi:hypothetical protein
LSSNSSVFELFLTDGEAGDAAAFFAEEEGMMGGLDDGG